MAKTFPTGDLVSVYTGFVMPPHGIGGIYQLLNHLTGDNLMTHQLPMAAEQMRQHLEHQFPWLIGLQPPSLDGVEDVAIRKATLEVWLAEVSAAQGEQHEVVPPSSSVWGKHDPIEDLHKVAPHMKVIPVVIDSEGE